MREFPLGWVRCAVGDLAELIRGVTYEKAEVKSEPKAGYVPILRATNIDQSLNFEELVFVPNRFVSDEQLLRPGDIVIAASSGSKSVVGKAAQFSGAWEGSFGAFCMGIRPSAPSDPRYFGYFFQSSDYRQTVSGLASGSNINNLKREHISGLPFNLPPVGEQGRIVEKLDEYLSDLDAGIAALERARTNLKRYRAAVLKAAVEGRLTEKWRAAHPDAEPAKKLLERILVERSKKWEEAQLKKYAEKGQSAPKGWKDRYREPAKPDVASRPRLPNGWCWASWSQVGLSQNGRSFPSSEYGDNGTKLLRPGNLYATGTVGWTKRNTKYLPENYAIENPDLIVGGGELVMNLTAQSLKDEFLGRTCITASDERCLLNQRLARLTPILVSRHFMLWLFKSAHFRKFVAGLNAGSLIQHMFTSQLEVFVLPLPPLEEQGTIVEAVEEQLSIIDNLESHIGDNLMGAQGLRHAILKRAFEGKLVPQDPKDEPASELLARIRASREVASKGDSGMRKKIRLKASDAI